MRRWLLVLSTLLLSAGALASSVVVYPFDSQDTLLGVAVADRVAAAFDGRATVVGPEVAPGLLPPLVAQGGFINLVTLVGSGAMTGPSGASLIRGATGADVGVTGSIAITDQGYRLSLEIASRSGLRRVTLDAPKDAPGLLAREAAGSVASALGLGVPKVDTTLDLSGAYGQYVRALALVSAGLPQDAGNLLSQLAQQGRLSARAQRLADDLDAVLGSGEGKDPLRMAVISLSLSQLVVTRSVELFQKALDATGLPVAQVWIGALDSSVNDKLGATAAFDRAAQSYPFGLAARAAYRNDRGIDGVSADIDAVLTRASNDTAGPASLLGASVAAQQAKLVDREKSALRALSHAAPFLTYSFERLSYIAFDQDQPLAAAEALRVAVELAPSNALYWTNLGWSYYLLGFFDRSQQASQKALDLDARESIAAYNLGLVKVVTGHLEAGLSDYSAALRVDPKVDQEAIHDLERARTRFPDATGVHFALARLYEANGQRSEARQAYQAYLDATTAGAPLRSEAEHRVTVLSAPPPPMELNGAVKLTLGQRGPDAAPYHPGDAVYPSFELSTPGDALPGQVSVSYRLLGGDGGAIATATEQVTVPSNAVGFVVDDLALTLPTDLSPGSFRLEIAARSSDGRNVTGQTTLDVAGAPEALRQLLGRGISMTSLDTGAKLYDGGDLQHPGALPGILVQELRATANEAEQALPKATTGRFKGLSGSEIFQRSTTQDVTDFLHYLLASGARNTSFTFVDAYAQWVLDGTPAEPKPNSQ